MIPNTSNGRRTIAPTCRPQGLQQRSLSPVTVVQEVTASGGGGQSVPCRCQSAGGEEVVGEGELFCGRLSRVFERIDQ